MKAPFTSYFGPGRKFLHGWLGKKMPTTKIPNDTVVHLDTSSNDEKTGCIPAEWRAILANIKEKVVYNTFTEMVANENIEEPLLLQATKREDYGHGEEGEGSGPTIDEGSSNIEAQCNPFQKIAELEQELATSKALAEQYKLKVEQLEEELVAQKNMVSHLSGNPH